MTQTPHMWKLHTFTTWLTRSSNMKAVSNVTPNVFSLSDTVMKQLATITNGGTGVLDNFCSVPKKQISDFRIILFQGVSLPCFILLHDHGTDAVRTSLRGTRKVTRIITIISVITNHEIFCYSAIMYSVSSKHVQACRKHER